MSRTNNPLQHATQVFAFALSFYLSLALFESRQTFAQPVSLYDNRTETVGMPPEVAGFPQNSMEWLAQPFRTGDQDNVSSVTISFRQSHAAAHASGNLSVELWSDGGSGIPGSLVDVVGLVDLGQLTDEWELVTLDAAIDGLTPQSTYHVVLDPSDTNVTTERSFSVAFYQSDAGANGAGNALIDIGNGWGPLRDLVGSDNFSFLQMAVTSGTAIPEPSTLSLIVIIIGTGLAMIRVRRR